MLLATQLTNVVRTKSSSLYLNAKNSHTSYEKMSFYFLFPAILTVTDMFCACAVLCFHAMPRCYQAWPRKKRVFAPSYQNGDGHLTRTDRAK